MARTGGSIDSRQDTIPSCLRPLDDTASFSSIGDANADGIDDLILFDGQQTLGLFWEKCHDPLFRLPGMVVLSVSGCANDASSRHQDAGAARVRYQRAEEEEPEVTRTRCRSVGTPDSFRPRSP